jgi:rhodanese-related sulfurtransferase/DNA-binding transcriptional ArsR family regulator
MSQEGRHYKDAVYEQLARIGKAVASPRRLEILDLLSQGPRGVDVLAAQTDQSSANTSHHLQILHAARLVESARTGTRVTYRIADDAVANLFVNLRDLAGSRLAEIEQVTQSFLTRREALDPIDSEALAERMRDGTVTVLDVRPAEEYVAGHLPGAISVPLGELESRVSELDRNDEIVAYCRGPYCVLAVEAVSRLRARGFEAVRLEDSVHDWRTKGFEVTSEPEAA